MRKRGVESPAGVAVNLAVVEGLFLLSMDVVKVGAVVALAVVGVLVVVLAMLGLVTESAPPVQIKHNSTLIKILKCSSKA